MGQAAESRSILGHLLNIRKPYSYETPDFRLICQGVTELTENFEPESEDVQYICENTKTTNTKISENSKENKEAYFSFDDDKERLFSAFMVKYGINLNKSDDLHWFEFIALMNDLNKTSFRNIVDLRMLTPQDMKNYSKEQKQEIAKQKKKFAIKKSLEQTYTNEQIQAIDNFDKLVGLK